MGVAGGPTSTRRLDRLYLPGVNAIPLSNNTANGTFTDITGTSRRIRRYITERNFGPSGAAYFGLTNNERIA